MMRAVVKTRAEDVMKLFPSECAGIGLAIALASSACGGNPPPAPPSSPPAPQTAAGLAWECTFDQADAWSDAAKDPKLGAKLDFKDGKAALKETGKVPWGKARIVVPEIDFGRGPELEIVVDRMEGSSWGAAVGIHPWDDAVYKKVATGEASTGARTYDLAKLTGWSDKRDIEIELDVEGDKTVSFDAMRIRYTK